MSTTREAPGLRKREKKRSLAVSIYGVVARRQGMPPEIASGLLFALLLLLSAARWLAGVAESLAGPLEET